jgi:uncharacterized protein YecE (DUF72 family)
MAFAGTGNALFPAYVRLLLQSRRLPGLDPGVGRRHHSRGFADAVVQHVTAAPSARVSASGKAVRPATMSALLIGTSGWTYDGWRDDFYPREIPKRHWLAWYAGQFATTEINGSFYRTPSLDAVRAWRNQTPEHFVFAWKASKFITHWKRLTDKCKNSLELMESRLKVLKPKVGPVLFQLPPQFKLNRSRLASFLRLLNNKRLYAFEFRDSGWYEPAVLDLLRDHGIALCLSDHHDAPSPWEATAGHVYVRGHGPTGKYKDRYPPATLQRWAAQIARWRKAGRSVYCYFDNDQKTAAPKDARRLVELTAAAGKRSPLAARRTG